MKNLNKKIGAGILALGVAIVGLGFFGGQVAHAGLVQEPADVDDLDLGLEEISEEDFLDLFEKMLDGVEVKEEDVDGVKTYKATFE